MITLEKRFITMTIIGIIGVILFIMGAVLVAMCFSGKADVTDFKYAIGLFAIGFFMMLADAEHSQSYKAVVTDFNGNQTTYNVRRYYTDGEKRASATTMTLILEDGTKVVAPIQNVIIVGQHREE